MRVLMCPPTRLPCASLPHRRFEVPQRPFSLSLRGRLAAPVLRRRESSSHCVYGLGLPARAANPHREHRFPSSSLVSSRAEYTRAYLPQSSSRFPIPPSLSVHGVVPATRLSLGTRSDNRSPLNRNSSKYVQHPIRALGPTPFEACSSTISLAMCEMLCAALG
ncbi:hypothetical protein B0H14DRAFT_1404206 [Mycena olivaceomarginata]|nr:hypothetical protein B0H14DRAFT_1404206 [Mycena olivaceomarginata]